MRLKGAVRRRALEGAVLVTGSSNNARYYGKPVFARDILDGRVPPPLAQRLCVPPCEGIEHTRVEELSLPLSPTGRDGRVAPVRARSGFGEDCLPGRSFTRGRR